MSGIPADIWAEAERVLLATRWNEIPIDDFGHAMRLIAVALNAERERCAYIAEEFPAQMIVIWDRPGGPPGNGTRATNFKDLAATIRKGGAL